MPHICDILATIESEDWVTVRFNIPKHLMNEAEKRAGPGKQFPNTSQLISYAVRIYIEGLVGGRKK